MKIPYFIKYPVFVISAFALSSCATPSQVYWDKKVKELCEKDGGVTVYEKVELTKEEYEKYGGINGVIPVPGENSSIANKYEYVSKVTELEINNSNPKVRRMEYVIYRKYDKKELGKMVTYSRIGGDMPTGVSEASHFGCADLKSINLNIEKEIFIIK